MWQWTKEKERAFTLCRKGVKRKEVCAQLHIAERTLRYWAAQQVWKTRWSAEVEEDFAQMNLELRMKYRMTKEQRLALAAQLDAEDAAWKAQLEAMKRKWAGH